MKLNKVILLILLLSIPTMSVAADIKNVEFARSTLAYSMIFKASKRLQEACKLAAFKCVGFKTPDIAIRILQLNLDYLELRFLRGYRYFQDEDYLQSIDVTVSNTVPTDRELADIVACCESDVLKYLNHPEPGFKDVRVSDVCLSISEVEAIFHK